MEHLQAVHPTPKGTNVQRERERRREREREREGGNESKEQRGGVIKK